MSGAPFGAPLSVFSKSLSRKNSCRTVSQYLLPSGLAVAEAGGVLVMDVGRRTVALTVARRR